ncbi:MAG: UDP-N-acetylglucosamine 2-epimerase (non-hydrolyzing) [Burkholderiaceae bacterium]|nr:UDP-N-acetylglucosamine 2-epimerase (non-hydrolyzing) [Burkholderiaceae bacterium]
MADKILSIFGTRPEAIKMAPLLRELAARPEIESLVCSTGQHQQMLDQALLAFGILPDLRLSAMTPSQTLNGLCSRLLSSIDETLARIQPDRVLVHGDTSTAMAAAIAAFQRRIPVAHVEAGLRTGDLQRPWPEEMNRRVVDVVGDLLFAPTPAARRNLLAENLQGRIVVTGNTGIDALMHADARIGSDPALRAALDASLPELDDQLQLILVTGHRRESFGKGFRDICAAIAGIARRRAVQIVYPVHLNPSVRHPVRQLLSGFSNIHLIEPLGYLEFVRLMQRASLVLTDSGGVQEEAPAIGKRVLIMREVTERPEAVETGMARVVGTHPRHVVEAVEEELNSVPSVPHRGAISP